MAKQFSNAQLARYLYMFDAGEYVRHSAIEDRTDNTYLAVTLNQHGEEEDYVLAILDTVSFDEISFFHNLISHLSYYGLPVPAPRRTLDGMTSTIFAGRPSLLMPKEEGNVVKTPSVEDCRAIGTLLGELHDATASYEHSRANPLTAAALSAAVAEANFDAALGALVQGAIDSAAALPTDLPTGVIHGDLSLNDVQFHEGEISAVQGFFRACSERLMQDVAAAENVWCTNVDGSLDESRQAAMLETYAEEREPTAAELDALPALSALAAARNVIVCSQTGADASAFERILTNR